MASQLSRGDPQIETGTSNTCDTPALSAVGSEEILKEQNKPTECVLKVTHTLDQPPPDKDGDVQPAALDSEASNPDHPLDPIQSRRSKNHGLQTDDADLRRYSRACKERKDGQAQSKSVNQSDLRDASMTRSARAEKLKAQQNLMSSKKPKKTGVKGKPSPQAELKRSATSSDSVETSKPETPEQSYVDVKVKTETDECSVSSQTHSGAAEGKFPKPRKIDKRSKRYRRMKAEAMCKMEKASAGSGDAGKLKKENEDNAGMSCKENADKNLSSGEDGAQSVGEQKPNVVTAHCSKGNNTQAESDKTEMDLDFEDALQVKTEVTDCKDFTVTHQSKAEVGAAVSVVQNDGEMEVEVSVPVGSSSPDIYQPPKRHRGRENSPPPPPPPPPPNEKHSKGGRRRRSGAPMKCEYCGRSFLHMSAYVIHLRIHTGEKPHECEICGRAFAQLSNLNSHMRVHGQSRRLLECCGTKFDTITSYRKHRKTHKETAQRKKLKPQRHMSDPSVLPCPTCGKGFRSRSTLETHMRIHSGEKPFSCKVCGKSFTQANSVRVHERIHWSVKTYVCMDCGRGFSQYQSLKVHVCKAKGGVSNSLTIGYRCHLCHKCIVDKHKYELHLQSHTDTERYSCDYCGQKFSLRSELNIHHLYCSQTNPAARVQEYPKPQMQSSPDYSPCSSPSQSTCPPLSPARQVTLPRDSYRSPPGSLQRPANEQMTYARLVSDPQRGTTPEPDALSRTKHHSLLTHSGKPLTSSMDDNWHPKRPLAVNAIIHQLNNLDQEQDPRRHFCPRCGRLFRHVMRLRAHMLTHTLGRSDLYTCDRCGKTLASWRQLWLHQRVHRQQRGRFVCPACTQGFRFLSSYLDHLRTHAELNAFTCSLCPRAFASSQALKAHQRYWHKRNIPYRCGQCGKGYSSQRKLDRHSISHQTVSQAGSDKRKVEQQPDVLPYQCAKCDLTFKTVDALFQHQLCHALSEHKVAGSKEEAESRNKPENTDRCNNSTSPHLSVHAQMEITKLPLHGNAC